MEGEESLGRVEEFLRGCVEGKPDGWVERAGPEYCPAWPCGLGCWYACCRFPSVGPVAEARSSCGFTLAFR